MANNTQATQIMLAHLYYCDLRGLQQNLDRLRAQPRSEDRDARIHRVLKKIRTYELTIRPVPSPGMTLEEERRQEELLARKLRDAHVAAGGSDPWADVPVYDGSPVV